MEHEIVMNDSFNINDKIQGIPTHPGTLMGVIEINRRNKITGETEFVHRGSNVITISGYQYILMKIFDLYLDSKHITDSDNMGRNTNLVMPDLNEMSPFNIGKRKAEYTDMNSNIAENHFIRGFMVGNGGAFEDTITAKNTSYSFINLRNPIPFQQTQSNTGLGKNGDKYIGVYNVPNSPTKSYYIKKFDKTPSIYHSWWEDGQAWDAVHKVKQNDLGPNPPNGVGATNRIETYVDCQLSISDDDFVSFFEHSGNTQTPMINELGLVAFDIDEGGKSDLIDLYNTTVQSFINIIFDKTIDNTNRADKNELVNQYIKTIIDTLTNYDYDTSANLTKLVDEVLEPYNYHYHQNPLDLSNETEVTNLRNALSSSDTIGVEAYYDHNNVLKYTTDHFVDYVNELSFDKGDEAQRIKLITYYTFNAIPIERNWELLINYRIYAN